MDLSSIQLDGSYTPAKRGGQAVGYQGRKKCKTTNSLFLTDAQGYILAMSTPQSGQHNDVFDLEKSFPKMLEDLNTATINYKDLFLNADTGFDCAKFRELCFKADIIDNVAYNKRNTKSADHQPLLDVELYKCRFCVERSNVWIDAFKCLLVRFETKIETWMSLHYLAFAIIFTRNL